MNDMQWLEGEGQVVAVMRAIPPFPQIDIIGARDVKRIFG